MENELPPDAEKIRNHLRRWRERLLDQTGRNPLLRRDGSRISRLSIVTPEADVLFRLLAVEGKSLRLPLVRRSENKRRDSGNKTRAAAADARLEGAPSPNEDAYKIEAGEIVFAAGAAEILRKLRRIRDNARTSLEERGVITLHLALGALHFSDSRLGGECVAPLWLLPCRLESHGPDRALTLAPADEEPSLNPSLELYLRERHKLPLPVAPEEASLDGFHRVLDTVFDAAAERGWRVEPEAWLSTFSFESLVLWRDLESHEKESLSHPVVRAFARAAVAPPDRSMVPEDLDTLPVPEEVPLPILETDSSQLEALTLAASGQNLVVHGPPGTGKSQTIANLIAGAIGQGKTVLFVSAKMAALEVVHRRLVEQGLGDYCLEAHSARSGKTKIAGELRRVLENAKQEPGSPLEQRMDDLHAVRDRLNRYVRALHAKQGALDRSLYDAIGEAEGTRSAPELRFALPWKDVLDVGAAELDEIGDALDELAALAEVYDGRDKHEWRGFQLPSDPAIEQNLESLLEAAAEAAEGLNGFDSPVGLLDAVAGATAERDAAAFDLSRRVRVPAAEAVEILGPAREEWTLWDRLSSRHRTWRRTVRNTLRSGVPATVDSLRATLSNAEQDVALDERLADAPDVPLDVMKTLRPALLAIAACWPEGFDRDEPVRAMTADRLAARCRELLDAREKRDAFTRMRLCTARVARLGLAPLLEALGVRSARRARAAFERRFQFAWATAALRGDETLAGFQGERQEMLIARFRDLDVAARSAALRRIHEKASSAAVAVREAAPQPEAAAGRGWGSGGEAPGNHVAAAEVATLRRELGKRRSMKPLRRLFAEAPHALQALKPCMLMSPVSVSTWLPPGSVSFDLVVFDEASQIPTPQAVPAILRAAQTVVAGDPKQLPPSTFFDASPEEREGDEDERDDLEPMESLLDECVAAVPSFREAHLRWHYRSEDERLIQFSNHSFYEDRLITFPSSAIWAGDRGVRLVHVPDGVWDRGRTRKNAVEARRVAEIVTDLVREDPGRSVGVIAMNLGQKEAIEDALAERLESSPELRRHFSAESPEPFFVKSLENVQGDERDAIVVSLGYGRDTTGALALNFGPLNNDGGWRRLNVLVTRAKRQTVVVSSLRASDLSGVNPGNRGASALRDYLQYAEQGGELGTGALPEREPDAFAKAVRVALEERGYRVDAHVGIGACRIELGVRHPDDDTRYLLGVECDGGAFASARSARDRDLLRRAALEGKGWRLHRVWSADWFRDRDATLDRLLRALMHARAATLRPLTLSEAR